MASAIWLRALFPVHTNRTRIGASGISRHLIFALAVSPELDVCAPVPRTIVRPMLPTSSATAETRYSCPVKASETATIRPTLVDAVKSP